MLNVLKRRYSWLPPNVVSWYHRSGNPKTARARPATKIELTRIASMYNRQKSMTVKMEKMLTKMDNTKETMVNLHAGAGNHRDLPALWVAERVLKPKSKLIVWILSEISGRCFHQPIEIKVSPKFLATHGELLQTGLSLFAKALPDDIPIVLPLVKELANGAVSAFGATVERTGRVHNMIDHLDLTEGGITRSNQSRTLPPAESYNLLQRILKEYDESFTTPSVSTITNLECATLDDGRYQWAHHEEHTGCQNRLRIDYASTSAAADPMSNSSVTTSVSNGEPPKYHMCDFVVDAQPGGKDWRRAYCAWEIVDSQQSLALESDQTIHNPHGDLLQQSLWFQSFVLTRVTSVKQLKECELRVTLKRLS